MLSSRVFLFMIAACCLLGPQHGFADEVDEDIVVEEMDGEEELSSEENPSTLSTIEQSAETHSKEAVKGFLDDLVEGGDS